MQAALGDVMQQKSGSVTYQKVDDAYFEARGLKRHAGVWLLWALGVGAVISGHFSGWNLGLASGGWGGMLIATVLIAVMYLGLTFSLAEMSPAMPHTGGAYSFARTAFGPWGGFLTGLAENVEYVMTAAVIVFFIGTYGAAIVGAPVEMQPLFWVAGYVLFVGLNYLGVEQSLKFSLIITVLALLCLVVFYVSAIPHIDFSRWALNIAPDGTELPEGNGPLFPFGLYGVLAALPFAVWLFLAIEQLPLAAEESVDPKRDMPKGIMLGMFTLMVSAFCVLFLNPSVIGVGSFKLGTSGEPLLDGFRAIYGEGFASALALVAVTGLVASLPRDHLCLRAADLLAVARRLFPARAVDNARHAQDAAHRHGGRGAARPRRDADGVVRRGRRPGRQGDRRHAAQHGGVRRHVLVRDAGPHLHSVEAQVPAHRPAV